MACSCYLGADVLQRGRERGNFNLVTAKFFGAVQHPVGYFDQLRQTLDLEKSVAYNVGEGRTYIKLNGKDRHVVGYLKGFLFSPKRALTPVKSLSGGERNRVILAKLFTRPANLLDRIRSRCPREDRQERHRDDDLEQGKTRRRPLRSH